MRLTHLDILEQCFHEKFRGYHKGEVETFLHLVAEDYQEMAQEIQTLKDQLAEKNRIVASLENSGKTKLAGNGNGQSSQKSASDDARKGNRPRHDESQVDIQKGMEELDLLKRDILKLKDERENLMENIKFRARNYVQSLKKSGDLPSPNVSANQKM